MEGSSMLETPVVLLDNFDEDSQMLYQRAKCNLDGLSEDFDFRRGLFKTICTSIIQNKAQS